MGYRHSEKYGGVRLFNNPNYDYAIMGITKDNRAVYDYENMVEIALISAEKHGISDSHAKDIIDKAIGRIDTEDKTAPIIMYRADFV